MFSCYFGNFCFMKFLPVDVSHCFSKGSITFIIYFSIWLYFFPLDFADQCSAANLQAQRPTLYWVMPHTSRVFNC